ncbi:YifB family Mg chelatase-like AAA ATPase [bacterium]|nr:YifB family Mg chelatase-like AAA ATPase [bacterium]
MELFAYEPLGFAGYLVKIEVDIRRGIPAVDIVGLAAASVRESRERVRAAVRNAGFAFPQDRVLINLSPADLPKEGSLYDLPIAAVVLGASGSVPDCGRAVLALGELTLDGSVRPVRGTLPALLRASRCGIEDFIVPAANWAEASRTGCGHIHPIGHISELQRILIAIREGASPQIPARAEADAGKAGDGQAGLAPAGGPSGSIFASEDAGDLFPGAGLDFSDYRGNDKVIRALLVAAAGRHNVLLFGPPGSGKTMAALRFPSLLPPLEDSVALEVAALWSLRGKRFMPLNGKTYPPVRAPHHSASLEGLVGGGRPLRPGEISLAHRGVLFLDETPEFSRDVLQSLREPLERGTIAIVRAGRVLQYPADFQLLLAANSCPCGNLGNPAKTCLCSPLEIQRYWRKIGGPLLDRIDMRIPVAVPGVASMVGAQPADQGKMLLRIESAVRRQMERSREWGGVFNSRLSPDLVRRFCSPVGKALDLLRDKADELGFSMRACHSVMKIARTIADLESCDEIEAPMVAEACGYREFGEGECYWPF